MFNTALIRTRLGQYGAAWLTGFVLSLIVVLGITWLSETPLVKAVDLVLPVAFAALTLGQLYVLVRTLLSGSESVATRLVVIVLTLLLFLPLLWAPVVGAISAAWIGQASIEYSAVYAQFRIRVSQALFDLAGMMFANPLMDTVWALFEGLATVVGFFAAFFQIWPRLLRLLGAREVQV